MTIEKIYYSNITNDINIIIKDFNIGQTLLENYILNIDFFLPTNPSVTFSTNTYQYAMDYNGKYAIISVLPSDVIDSNTNVDFIMDGVISAVISTVDGETNYMYFYDDSKLNTYKVEMYSMSDFPFENKKTIKDMTKFIFLELAFKNSIEVGDSFNATLFYNEMIKMYRTFKSIYK